MSDAALGYQSRYAIHDGESPGTFFDIGEVTEINPGEESVDRVDVTHMQSPDRRREFIAGLIDSGEASFSINWVPGNDTDVFIRALQISGETRDHRITLPNGVSVTYEGQIMAFTKVLPIDDRMTATITVARSGGEVWGNPAAPENIVLPAISGIAQVGQTLTAYSGNWDNAGPYTYQWQEDDGGWSDITGATSKTYVPVAGNVGNPLRITVTSTNSVGAVSANSAATAAVIAA